MISRTREASASVPALGFVLDAVVTGFEVTFAILEVLMAVSGYVFPMLTITQGQIAEQFGWLDAQLLSHLVLFFAILYLLDLASKVRRTLKEENGS